MKRSIWLVCLWLACCHKPEEVIDNNVGTPIGVDAVRQVLAKGVNLTNWFNDYSDPTQFGTRFSAADMVRIKAEGFTYIRLPIGSPLLYQDNVPDQLNAINTKYVDAAVQRALDAGLAVVLDAVHDSNDNLESKVASLPGYSDKMAKFWGALAKYFSKYRTDQLFFEVWNEPHVASDGGAPVSKTWWWPVQEKCIKAIRRITANHYIIVGAEAWNSRYELMSNTPYSEANIVYNFHFYDPFLFTHQGATWTNWPAGEAARGVPFPANATVLDSLIGATSFQDLKNALQDYKTQNYNFNSLVDWIKPVADWATNNNVLVTCNEFGSYKLYSPRASRLAWIHDIRTALEQNNVGWAMWDYDEGFGLIDYTNNDRSSPVEDDEVLVALGMK
jgi:aryl-phospho-beta-D-glucosidase BglC (GH1 family)